jgi:hypothetical protein
VIAPPDIEASSKAKRRRAMPPLRGDITKI